MGRKISPQEAAAIGISFSPAQAQASLKETPETQTPAPEDDGRSFGGKVVDTVSDALPTTGALIGGAAGAFGGPVGLATIPLGGAAGYGAGELLKRFVDLVSNRPGKAPPIDALGSAKKGAVEGMNAFSVGQILGKAASGLEEMGSLADDIGAAGNPFGNLGDKAFRAVHETAMQPAKPIMAAPRGALAETGAKFASPASAEAAQRGAGHLRRLASPLAQDAEIGQAGARGEKLDRFSEHFLRNNVEPLAEASGKAIDTISSKLPPRLMEPTAGEAGVRPELAGDPHDWIPPVAGSEQPAISRTARLLHPAIEPVQGPSLPPGGDVVNKAFNEPGSQNAIIRDPESMKALADVKSKGLESAAAGPIRSEGFADKLRADAQGITPSAADQAGKDATELESLARTLQRQRGGIQQQGPSGFLPRTMYEAQKLVAGPRSTMMGMRPETPESALQNNTIRMAELEAAKRGMPALDPAARSFAMSPQTRPLPAAIASPNGRALSGAEIELLRQFLSGEQR